MKYYTIFLFFVVLPSLVFSQDPLRFENEIQRLTAGDSSIDTRKLILFTGSSSIRRWRELPSDFATHNVLNRGFGSSEMSDLYYYTNELILKYKPIKIFIYEGDNDINSGKSYEEIIRDAEKILLLVRKNLPRSVKVYFISAKPSIARRHLRSKYEAYNQKLKEWCSQQKGVVYVDVWTPMLDSNGEIRNDLFVEDNLHMNRKGYDIWKNVIGKLL